MTLLLGLLLALAQGGTLAEDDPLSGRWPRAIVHLEADPLSGRQPQVAVHQEVEVTRLIAGARSEVLLEMDVFDDRAVAEGWRVAVGERGARGYILVRGATAEIGASYLPWASILQGTQARLLAYTRLDYVVVDRRIAAIREERMGLPVWRLEERPERVAALVRQFIEAFRIARPYSVEGLVRRIVEKHLR